MKNFLSITLISAFLLGSFQSQAQNSVSELNINDYPKYLVITTVSSSLFFGSDIFIYSRNSPHEDQLMVLEKVLQNRKKMKIRNQTDLLNAMDAFGYDYVDAFNSDANSSGSSATLDDDTAIGSSDSKFRVNIVFKKK